MRLMDAQEHTEAVGGEWHGHYGLVPCPVCQPERRPDQRALSIRDGDGLFRFEVFCQGEGCEMEEIVTALHGLEAWGRQHIEAHYDFPHRRDEPPRKRRAWLEERRRRENWSLRTWSEAEPLQGSPAEIYLHKLGIVGPLPDTLRYHARCWHQDGHLQPAMIALVKDGPWKMLNVSYLPLDFDMEGEVVGRPDVFLSAVGEAVCIVEPSPDVVAPIIVIESIESALRLASAKNLAGPVHILAALSPEGLASLRLPETCERGFIYPKAPGRLIIAPESEPESERAGYELANRARAAGWDVEFLKLPTTYTWSNLPLGSLALSRPQAA